MALSLPSKKIQAFIIVVVALFLAYGVSTLDIRAWFQSEPSTASLEAAAIKSIDSDIDTDKDGLKDWQEILWGTDKDNADTDADGTKDGEEIEKGRDPKVSVVSGDDSLEKTRGISAESVSSFSSSVSADPDNLSTAVSKDLFAKFMSLQTSGNLNDDTQAELIDSVIADINPGSIPPRYTISDVSIVDANTATLKVYGNAIAKVLVTLQTKVTPNSSNDESLAFYEDAINSLKSTQAPATLGLTHLQLLNSFNATYQMLVLLAEYEKDPIKGLAALKSLQTNAANTIEIFDTIAAELKKNDIIFDKVEAGYIWNNYR